MEEHATSAPVLSPCKAHSFFWKPLSHYSITIKQWYWINFEIDLDETVQIRARTRTCCITGHRKRPVRATSSVVSRLRGRSDRMERGHFRDKTCPAGCFYGVWVVRAGTYFVVWQACPSNHWPSKKLWTMHDTWQLPFAIFGLHRPWGWGCRCWSPTSQLSSTSVSNNFSDSNLINRRICDNVASLRARLHCRESLLSPTLTWKIYKKTEVWAVRSLRAAIQPTTTGCHFSDCRTI